MPRSKRKAAALDFAKKKKKLGTKKRPENLTDTSFKQKQINVLNQTRQQTPSKHGLPLSELLNRSRHHNAKTRETSLNTITNALTDASAAAHLAVFRPADVISAAGDALADHVRLVRLAASGLLLECLSVVKWGGIELVSTLIKAALSNIRTDVRVDTAKLIVRMKENGFIGFVGRPFDSLCDLLTAVSTTRARTIVLDAISAVCSSVVIDGAKNSEEPFFHHRTESFNNTGVEMQQMAPEKLISRIAEVTVECMPLSDHAADSAVCDLITSSSKALSLVSHSGISELTQKRVQHLLTSWSQSYYHGMHEAQAFLSMVALKCGEMDVAAEYVAFSLSKGKYFDIDVCVRELILRDEKVMDAWIRLLDRSIYRKDMEFLRLCHGAVEVLVTSVEAPPRRIQTVLEKIPDAVALLLTGEENLSSGTLKLIEQFCDGWRLLHESRIQDIGELATKMLEITLSRRPVSGRVLDLLTSIAVPAKVIFNDIVVQYLLACCKREDYESTQRILAGVEWLTSDVNKQNLKAVAVARIVSEMCENDTECSSTALRIIDSATRRNA